MCAITRTRPASRRATCFAHCLVAAWSFCRGRPGRASHFHQGARDKFRRCQGQHPTAAAVQAGAVSLNDAYQQDQTLIAPGSGALRSAWFLFEYADDPLLLNHAGARNSIFSPLVSSRSLYPALDLLRSSSKLLHPAILLRQNADDDRSSSRAGHLQPMLQRGIAGPERVEIMPAVALAADGGKRLPCACCVHRIFQQRGIERTG